MNIDFTYSIEQFDTVNMRMTIRYKSPGKNEQLAIMPIELMPGMTLQESVTRMAEISAPFGVWQAQEQPLDPADVDAIMAKQDVPASTTIPTDDRSDTQKALDAVAFARLKKEGTGVTWAAPNGDTIYLDTTQARQARFSAATTAIASGLRTDPSKWKCARITETGPELIFRETSNAELLAWAGLVLGHVQKCFDAEAATVAKILAGDLTADFEAEFTAL